jgi:tetratricopeptide (TPR) repeat protein
MFEEVIRHRLRGWKMNIRSGIRIVSALIVVATSSAAAGLAFGAGKAQTAELPQNRVASLIRQLGDEQYSVRQQAQEELAQLGADAFDALVAAEHDDDIEIASRARYLVHLIRIDWVRESDSAQVKELLKDYDSAAEDDRRLCMERLAESTIGEAGLEPLCRLIRFERSPLLSKEGAILILAEPEPDASAWPQRARIITGALKGSSRSASKWLLAYAKFHVDPETALAEWDKLVSEELAVSEPLAAQDESRIQTFLLRKQAEMLLGRKHEEQALAVMRKMIDRESDDTDSLTEFVGWLAKNKAWSVVDDVSKRFERTFNASPKLLYTLAQACKTKGNVELAEQFALKAFRLGADSDDAKALPARFNTAYWLEQTGMMAWSEREYRYVIKHGDQTSPVVAESRNYLAELLHDEDHDGAAAEVLQGLVEALPKNEELAKMLAARRHPLKSIRSRMFFFQACQFAADGDRGHQIEQLDRAIASDPTDADVLIALYRLPGQDDKRRAHTLELIRQATQQFQNELNDDPDNYSVCNEYAWLVGNTEGDLERALECGLKACEIRPDEGGLLDTLAHCYAAKKDFENAVKYQSRAAELEPYSRQIQHALEDYRKALEAAKTRK